MINKIELIETVNSFDISVITLDLKNKNLIYIKNNSTIKNEALNNSEEIEELLKKYITYWDNEYIDNTVVGGNEAELIINTNDELIKYVFKNKYPYNYNEFLKDLKTMVGVL